MHAFLATIRKDLKLLAKDPAALAILFLMPLVFILVMSLALGNLYNSAGRQIAIAVVDEDRGAIGKELVRSLREAGGFAVVTEWQGTALDRASAEKLIRDRQQQVALVLPPGLSNAVADLLSGRRDAAREILVMVDPALSPEVLAPLRGALKGLTQEAAFRSLASLGVEQMLATLAERGVTLPEDLVHRFREGAALGQGRDLSLVALREAAPAGMAAPRKPNSVEQNVPAYTLLGMFFIALQLAGNIIEEKRLGTFRRLLAAPQPRGVLLAGKLAAFVCLNLVQVAVMFAVGVLMLPLIGAPAMSLGAHPEALVPISLAVALAANSLGLLLAAVARSPAQSTGLGLIVVLTSAMLGGIMVPRFIMPPFMQMLGLVSPHSWGLIAYQDVLMPGADIVAVLPDIAVLLAFAAVFFAIAAWRFRWD